MIFFLDQEYLNSMSEMTQIPLHEFSNTWDFLKQEMETSSNEFVDDIALKIHRETMVKVPGTKDSDTQTEILVTEKFGQKEKETILEMRINHEDLDAEKIETFIEKRLRFSLIGKPWIANSGRHFVTVGFRTWTSDYEKWKVNSVNWQDSGIRAVNFSRLYQQ